MNKVEITGVNTSRLKTLPESEKTRLLLLARQGDPAAREQLVSGNLRLVLSVVQKFAGRSENPDDLFQVGCIGLIKAIDHFDPAFDVRFSTYAVPMIAGEIKRFLRDDGPVKVSRTIKENGMKIAVARQRFQTAEGREPTLQELSEQTGLSREEIVIAMEASASVESIYSAVYQEDGSEIYLVDKVVRGERGSVGSSLGLGMGGEDAEKEKLLNHMLLKQLLDSLNPQEKNLIRMRYFQNKTQMEVAAVLGVSQVQVSRLEKKILRSLRERAQ